MLGSIIEGIGSLFGGKSNYDAQKSFAQRGIQWRVQDAKKAGIHPLYALGAQTHSFQPSSNFGDGLQAMGQDISRAQMAGREREERRSELLRLSAREEADRAIERERSGVLFQQQVERNNLDNALLASQIARLQSDQLGPPPPSGGSGRYVPPSPRYQPQAFAPNIGSVYGAQREPGAITSYGYRRRDDGGLSVVPSQDAKERTEDDFIEQLMWNWDNRVVPSIHGLRPPSIQEYPTPFPDQTWVWDARRQAFYPQNNSDIHRRSRSRRWRGVGRVRERN